MKKKYGRTADIVGITLASMSLLLGAAALTQVADLATRISTLSQATGPRGEAGPKGEVGPKGDTGATGATGATGSKGQPGATGKTGPRGAQGVAGKSTPAVRYFATFISLVNQNNLASTNSVIGLSATNANAVWLQSSKTIRVRHSGVYEVQAQASFINNASGSWQAKVWFIKNGVPVKNSASAIASDVSGAAVQANATSTVQLNTTDKLTVAWSATDSNVGLASDAEQGSPVIAAVPSIRLVISSLR